jgi:hypothetical protein
VEAALPETTGPFHAAFWVNSTTASDNHEGNPEVECSTRLQ